MNEFQERTARLSARSPFAAGALSGAIAGLPFGVFAGVTNHSAGAGVFEGVFFAVFFGLAMGFIIRRAARRSFQGSETPTQRVEASLAVANGKAISDRSLGPAVVAIADRVLQQNTGAMATIGRWFSPVAICISVAFFFDAHSRHDSTVMSAWTVLGALSVANLWLMPRRQNKLAANARQARQHAEALINSASNP